MKHQLRNSASIDVGSEKNNQEIRRDVLFGLKDLFGTLRTVLMTDQVEEEIAF